MCSSVTAHVSREECALCRWLLCTLRAGGDVESTDAYGERADGPARHRRSFTPMSPVVVASSPRVTARAHIRCVGNLQSRLVVAVEHLICSFDTHLTPNEANNSEPGRLGQAS